ncbi:MAG TPA: DUF4142 domain-containing protein [Verrucomicrobiae bacterium]|jgi:putative membrane protein|nr:DUF4142 domain-containing protein [Verrucomicrobiae bacterium]
MKLKRILNGSMLALALAAMCGFAAAQASNGQMGSNTTGNHMTNTSSSSTSSSSELSTADKHFVMEAARADKAEVELGKLAEQKTSNPEVKQFAERMIHDHTQNDDQLKQVAEKTGVTLPASLSTKDAALKEKLSGLSGEQFDKTYMQNMVTDHTQDVAAFKHESMDGKDSAVKNYASESLPTLESHLKEARHIEPMVAKNMPMSKGQ